MLKSVLVAGGAGYIGSHAVHQLVERGYEVAVVDNLRTGRRAAVHPKSVFYEGDLRNRTFLTQVFSRHRFDAVIHFAASSVVGESMKMPLDYFDNNVYGTQVLLEVMRDAEVKKIVFSSTAATYGEPEKVPITEDMPTNPTNAYGETKLAMEKMMKWAEVAYGLKYVALRYFNVAGARDGGDLGEAHEPETHLIPLVLKVALGKTPAITVFGRDYPTPDGTCIRDYIHVEDLIDAHVLALEYLNSSGTSNTFNLGSSQGFSVEEILSAARKVTGHAIPAQLGARRAGDPARLIAGSEKAQKLLGWKPSRTSIERIISDAWQWHSRHPDGYTASI